MKDYAPRPQDDRPRQYVNVDGKLYPVAVVKYDYVRIDGVVRKFRVK